MELLEFIELMKILKEIYDTCEWISELLIDKTQMILERISKNTYKAAINNLKDCRFSNYPEREIASAITQLRLVLENSNDEWLKFETSYIILLCYRKLGEEKLMEVYKKRAIEYYNKHMESAVKDIYWKGFMSIYPINIFSKYYTLEKLFQRYFNYKITYFQSLSMIYFNTKARILAEKFKENLSTHLKEL